MRHRLYAIALVALGLLADAVFMSARAENARRGARSAGTVATLTSCLRQSATPSYGVIRVGGGSFLPAMCGEIGR
jgi:hypothetical protein